MFIKAFNLYLFLLESWIIERVILLYHEHNVFIGYWNKLQVQSYKFVPLVYQIASRMGGSREGHRRNNFQVNKPLLTVAPVKVFCP